MAKVLIVVPTCAEMDGRPAGYSSLAPVYNKLMNSIPGVGIVLASVEGGKCVINPTSAEKYKEEGIFLSKNKMAKDILEKTNSIKYLMGSEFNAVYFTGGPGAMYDFTGNREVGRIGRQVYESGGVIAANAQGTVSLMTFKHSDRTSIMRGIRCTGPSNEEEEETGMHDVYPMQYSFVNKVHVHLGKTCEDVLVGMLGNYSKAKEKWSSHVVISQCGRIITGQNENSATELADKLVEVLKRQCVNIINEKEEKDEKEKVTEITDSTRRRGKVLSSKAAASSSSSSPPEKSDTVRIVVTETDLEANYGRGRTTFILDKFSTPQEIIEAMGNKTVANLWDMNKMPGRVASREPDKKKRSGELPTKGAVCQLVEFGADGLWRQKHTPVRAHTLEPAFERLGYGNDDILERIREIDGEIDGEPKKRDKPVPLGILNFVEKACTSIPKENKDKMKKYGDLLPPLRREPYRNRPVEYAIIIEGEITVILDSKEEKTLHVDEVLIMHGLNHHYWANRGKDACRVLFVWCAVAHHLEDLRPPRISDKKAEEYMKGNPNETAGHLFNQFREAFPEEDISYEEFKEQKKKEGKMKEKKYRDTEALKAIMEDDDWAERTVRAKFGEEYEDDPSVDWYKKHGFNKEIFDYSKPLPYSYADDCGIHPSDEETVPPLIPTLDGWYLDTNNNDPTKAQTAAAVSADNIASVSAGLATVNIGGSDVEPSGPSESFSNAPSKPEKGEKSTNTNEKETIPENVTSRSRSRNNRKKTSS